ncbi:MAG: sodium/proton-translocating pyrophosphatase, partial [Spirochaetaceae bacterium]|nr:sodium/proton-translocating pyrophosphatase [Spirochaetaceae bacterium]
MQATVPLISAGAAGLLALGYAATRARWIYRQSVEAPNLARIAGYIADGAKAFLTREYAVLAPFVLVAAAFLAVANEGPLRFQAAAFALGAIASGASGWFGMKVATAANSRTAQAATRSLAQALKVAFTGGSVMGMTVVGLALVGVSVVVAASLWAFGTDAAAMSGTVFPILSGFSLGASTIALFARVGGGIFTKAADVGADLVGKVEAGIPEDDPRNPAVIADNVGDNVGDVAGMGADLFESYAGSIIGCVVLGASISASDDLRARLAFLPILIAAIGVGASVLGTFFVKVGEKGSPQKALNAGSFGAAAIAAVALYPVVALAMGDESYGQDVGAFRVYLSAILGLGAGVAIGMIT